MDDRELKDEELSGVSGGVTLPDCVRVPIGDAPEGPTIGRVMLLPSKCVPDAPVRNSRQQPVAADHGQGRPGAGSELPPPQIPTPDLPLLP